MAFSGPFGDELLFCSGVLEGKSTIKESILKVLLHLLRRCETGVVLGASTPSQEVWVDEESIKKDGKT